MLKNLVKNCKNWLKQKNRDEIQQPEIQKYTVRTHTKPNTLQTKQKRRAKNKVARKARRVNRLRGAA